MTTPTTIIKTALTTFLEAVYNPDTAGQPIDTRTAELASLAETAAGDVEAALIEAGLSIVPTEGEG